MRELIEGTLVEDPDELTDILRAPPICEVLREVLLDRIGGGSGSTGWISPALSASVFLFGFAGTVVTLPVSPRSPIRMCHSRADFFSTGKPGGGIARAFASFSVTSCSIFPGVAGILLGLIFMILGNGGSWYCNATVSILVANEVLRDRVDLTLGDLGDLIEAEGEAVGSATDTRLGVLAGDVGSMIGLGDRSHRGEAASSRDSDDAIARCIGGYKAQSES